MTRGGITSDTIITTNKGKIRVSELINRPFTAIIRGEEYVCEKGFHSCGKKLVYEVLTDLGYFIHTSIDVLFYTTESWRSFRDLLGKKVELESGVNSRVESITMLNYEEVYTCHVNIISAIYANNILIHV